MFQCLVEVIAGGIAQCEFSEGFGIIRIFFQRPGQQQKRIAQIAVQTGLGDPSSSAAMPEIPG
jgi:hypothetical protein